MPTELEQDTLRAALHALRSGRHAQAESAAQAALRDDPASAPAHHLLGLVALHRGELDRAAALVERAMAIDPGRAGYACDLAIVYRDQGRIEAAVGAFERAIALAPGLARAHFELAVLLHGRGDVARAQAGFERVVELDPTNAGAHSNLGILLHAAGDSQRAVECLRTALRIAPQHANAHCNLGVVLAAMGRTDEAIEHYRQAIANDAKLAEAHSNLALALSGQGGIDAAVAGFETALALAPSNPDIRKGYAKTILERGDFTAAARAYRDGLALDPRDASMHSNLLFCMHYDPGKDVQTIYAAHRDWAAAHCRDLDRGEDRDREKEDPDRPIRVGYLSPDFRSHPVGHFMEPVLDAHDHARVEVHCYHCAPDSDAVTARLEPLASRWHRVAGLSASTLAELVRAHRIDILVDLAGHTAGGNLQLVLARKPAPVQVTWLGYVNTTGQRAVDYLLTDEGAVPAGSAQPFSESVLRLPGAQWCYRPSEPRPGLTPPPAHASRAVTFGCFNALAKLNESVFAVWTEILTRVPASRLLLKSRPLGDAATRRRYRAALAARGVPVERVELRGISDRTGYFTELAELDVALDPFPYSGGTLTCDTLWMGVPVITLRGDSLVGRNSTSVLRSLELAQCITDSRAEYVERAVAMAGDLDALGRLRHTMRDRFLASPIGQPQRFVRGLEDAYRGMWRRWCAGDAPPAHGDRP